MPSKKTVKKLTKEMQRKIIAMRRSGLRVSFAYHENATMCFIYADNNPEEVKAYAQAVKCSDDENDVKFARTVAFERAEKAMLHQQVKFYGLYLGDLEKQNVRYITKQTGVPGPRSTLPAPILAKTLELIRKYQSHKETATA